MNPEPVVMKHFVPASAALALIASIATPQATPTGDGADATVEDVEVLRRILVKDLTAALAEQRTSAAPAAEEQTARERADVIGYSLGTTVVAADSSGTSPVTHSRGFHLPGHGVFLSLDVQVPIREAVDAPPGEVDGGDADEELDEWEETRREIQGRAPAWTRTPASALAGVRAGYLISDVRQLAARRFELDPAAVAAIERSVLGTLERHGARVRGLAGAEAFTVALHLGPCGDAQWPVTVLARDQVAWQDWVGRYTAHQASAQRVVVRVGRGDLEGLTSEAGKAQVHRY